MKKEFDMEKMNDVLVEQLSKIIDDEKAKNFIDNSSINVTIDIAEKILTHNDKEQIIKELLDKLKEYEKQKQDGRDHVIHTIHTYLLGVHIIDKLQIDDNNDSYFIWGITSLFHDIGYEHADYFSKVSPINKFDKDHGFWSSKITWNILFSKYIDENPDKSPNKIVDHECYQTNFSWGNLEKYILPACEAILLHNTPTNYLNKPSKKVDFSKNKYAFLLILCDTIQNWSRPKNGEEYPKSKPYEYSIECHYNDEKYKITVDFPNETEARKVKKELQQKCLLKVDLERGTKLSISWGARSEEDQNKR